MKSIEAVLRIISGVCAFVFFLLLKESGMALSFNQLMITTILYIMFLFFKKMLFQFNQGLTWHTMVEWIELILVLFLCKELSAEQGLLLCSLYLIRFLMFCTKSQVIVQIMVTTVGYLAISLINLAWQVVWDVDTISFLFTTVGLIVIPASICRWCVYQVKRSNNYLDNTKNLLAVKEKLLEELEQSREKTRVYAEELSYVAKVDFLTRLYNRKYLYEYMEYMISDFTHDANQSIIVADLFVSNIDIYDEENQLGAKDKIIEEVASIIQTLIDKNDLAARYDGCEFIIIFQGKSIKQAEAKAKEIKRTFEKRREEHSEEWLLHIDFGTTLIESNKETVATIIQRARKDRKFRGRG